MTAVVPETTATVTLDANMKLDAIGGTPASEEPANSARIVGPESVGGRSTSLNARKRTRQVLASFYFFFFCLGLNAGSTGSLLPRYQDFYHVRTFLRT